MSLYFHIAGQTRRVRLRDEFKEEEHKRDEGGKFSETGRSSSGGGEGEAADIPDEVKQHKFFKSFFERGAHETRINNDNPKFPEIEFHPKLTPNVKQYHSGRQDQPNKVAYYDPRYAELQTINEDEPIIAKQIAVPKEGIREDFDPLDDPDTIYRGVSAEEYDAIKKTGEVKSKGTHNIGGEQEGLTYWSTDPSQARHYANSFAPAEFKPTFTHPAYIVATKRPKETKEVKGTGANEVGVARPIRHDEITGMWRGDPYIYEPGRYSVPKSASSGQSGVAPDAYVRWSKIDHTEELQRLRDAAWNEEEHKRGGNPANRGQFSKGAGPAFKAGENSRPRTPADHKEQAHWHEAEAERRDRQAKAHQDRGRRGLAVEELDKAEEHRSLAEHHLDMSDVLALASSTPSESVTPSPGAPDKPLSGSPSDQAAVQKSHRDVEAAVEAYNGSSKSPEDHKKALTDIGHAVFGYMGLHKNVKLDIDEPYDFKVGDKEFHTGGWYNGNENTVTLCSDIDPTNPRLPELVCHEAMHAKFHAVEMAYMAESDRLRYADIEELDKIIAPDGTIRPDYQKEFPVHAALKYFPGDARSMIRLEKDDGITDYSRAYWEAANNGVGNVITAINETLAEMAKLDHEGSLPRLLWYKWSKSFKPLYKAINKLYPDCAEKLKLPEKIRP